MKQAFTLVELSIVLVILGLLVGGVLAGQNLVRAAELRAVIADMNRYETVVMAFREKYFQLPGDMDNATDFWGEGSSCATGVSTGGTCNGDGDGNIEWSWGYPRECRQNMWQHLYHSGLVTTGFDPSIPQQSDLEGGVNVPATPIGQGVYLWCWVGVGSYVTSIYGNTGNYLSAFGTHENNSQNNRLGALFTPDEAWNIDKKTDDGEAASGRMLVTKGLRDNSTNVESGCVDGDFRSATTANWNLASEDAHCMIHQRMSR